MEKTPKEFRELEKLRKAIESSTRAPESLYFEQFKGLPFWIKDRRAHEARYYETDGFCCFNHAVGLPTKDSETGQEQQLPMFPYELEVIEAIEEHRLVWILKATGLGITELILRYIAWIALRDNRYRGQLFAIVTGPRQELAEDLIRRLKDLFSEAITFDSSKTVAILNGVIIQAFPSHHLDALRGRNPKLIFVDEGDFFPKQEQENLRPIVERYIPKSNPIIILVSTPKTPDGLMHTIQKEEPSIYHKIFLYYTIGMPELKIPNFLKAETWDQALSIIKTERLYEHMPIEELERGLVANPEVRTMYRLPEIIKAFQVPSFDQEYRLKYGFGDGNIFSSKLLEEAIQRYDLEYKGGRVVITCDPAYGSSKFAIVIIEQRNGVLHVLVAEQFERPDPSVMINRLATYADSFNKRCTILVDQARPEIKDGILRKGYHATAVDFSKELDRMTMRAVQAVERRKVRIHPKFEDLIMQLRAITYNEKGHPDKKKNPYDLGDAFQMNVAQFNFGEIKFIELGKA